MSLIIDLSGLDRIRKRFERIANPDATPLMLSWMIIIEQDNRRGVLAGLDKNGAPMLPVTYRPVGKPIKLRNQSRAYNAMGTEGNLTSSQYRRLTGPPLAPRGQFSRVITNLQTDWQDGREHPPWMAWARWKGVVSKTGFEFLPVHFEGKPLGRGGPRKQRDLRGLRPDGHAKAREAMINWAEGEIRIAV